MFSHDFIVFLMLFDMVLMFAAAALPNRIKLLMLFDMFSWFASVVRKTFDQDHVRDD